MIQNIFGQIANNYSNPALRTSTIISVLACVLVLSLLEFLVYRLISNREFYNRSFNIAIAIIPFFISTIILSLQSNIVITLGTIGALAIIRFRTAIKNPVDMLYLLWSVHIGITCGCQLYELSFITFIIVAILLFAFEHIRLGKAFYVLVFHYDGEDESLITAALNGANCKYKIKSRNYSSKGIDYVVELSSKECDAVANKLKSLGIEKLSIMAYDNDDII